MAEEFSHREKDTALRRLNYAKHKDYWSVTDMQDNMEELQEAIDVIYNSIEGNKYSVEYQENQNGTRLVINCTVCSKSLTSYDPFITHENGKNHKKVRQKTLTVVDPNIQEEIRMRPVNSPRGIFPANSLEDQIESTSHYVLGVQFVYKEIIDDVECFTCQLCRGTVEQVSTTRMFAHLTSSRHNRLYLETKFGFVTNSTREFEEKCLSTEKYEGKIHTSITNLTSPSFTKSFKRPQSSSPNRKSPSPGNWSTEKKPKIPKQESPEITLSRDTFEPVAKPSTRDIGITADMPSGTQQFLQQINAMHEPDSLMILQDDEDMQVLLKQTLWALSNKLEKYFRQTGATFMEGSTRTKVSLATSAEKVKEYVVELAAMK